MLPLIQLNRTCSPLRSSEKMTAGLDEVTCCQPRFRFFSDDAQSNLVGQFRQRFKSALIERIAGKHGQDAHQAIFDKQRYASEGGHVLASPSPDR